MNTGGGDRTRMTLVGSRDFKSVAPQATATFSEGSASIAIHGVRVSCHGYRNTYRNNPTSAFRVEHAEIPAGIRRLLADLVAEVRA